MTRYVRPSLQSAKGFAIQLNPKSAEYQLNELRIWVVSSKFQIVQIQSHFELVISILALEATELVSEQVTQMTVELIHFSAAKEISVKATFFFVKKLQQTNVERMLKCCGNPSELVSCK